ncbi:MAG: mannose-6-phosphate isomerase, class I [Puia sp.]|nr:mannose-6-phosphate isomerase, class I [Puia sp.]
MEQYKNKVFRLQGKLQQYAWGGHSFLPALLGIKEPGERPYAEYWMGAHDNASSEIILPGTGTAVRLNEYIAAFPQDLLGKQVAEKFGRLPYLLKILDVRDMLSIQVHPSKKEAEKEFAGENKRGIPLNAADRNYKDDNHKPELMVALSEFWLLHGFKPEDLLKATLQRIPELSFLAPAFGSGGYQELYKTVMEMDQARVNALLQPLLDRILPAYKEGRLPKDSEDFWAARAALTFNTDGRTDRGIFSVYLFNLVNLHPGEAIFQDAGLPHAYLEGQNVEIMANSDNVLRGGLTPKHVDVPELMKHIVFARTVPHTIYGKEVFPHIAAFRTPAPDFELSQILLPEKSPVTIASHSVEIFIVMEGKVKITEKNGDVFERKTGECFIAFDRAELSLQGVSDTVIYRAAVPE